MSPQTCKVSFAVRNGQVIVNHPTDQQYCKFHVCSPLTNDLTYHDLTNQLFCYVNPPGYTAVRGDDGFLYYATQGVNLELVPTPFVVGKVNPKSKGLPKGLKDKSKKDKAKKSGKRTRRLRGAEEEDRRLAIVPTTGTLKNLVIPIRFADHKNRVLPTRADIDILMNSRTPHTTLAKTGSVWSVFNENSYGKLNLESTVVDWVDTRYNEATIGAGDSG
jgi:hypothetical protein